MLTHVHIFVSDVQQSGLEHSTPVNNRGQPNKEQEQQLTISKTNEHEDQRRYLKKQD